MPKHSFSITDLEANDPGAKRGGTERRFLCPLCGGSKPRNDVHRSLGLNVAKGTWLCHRCHEKGLIKDKWTPLEPFVPKAKPKRLTSMPRAAWREPLAVNATPTKPDQPEGTLNPTFQKITAALTPLRGTPGQEYLEARGIPIETAEAAKVMFHPQFRFASGEGPHPCLIFPLRNAQGDLVAISIRAAAIGVKGFQTEAKIKGGQKHGGVFSTPGAFDSEYAILTEAGIDALSLALCGFPAIAAIGVNFPEWVPARFANRGKILVATDADAAGEDAVDKLQEQLSRNRSIGRRLRPAYPAKDWNDELTHRGKEELTDYLQGILNPRVTVVQQDQPAAYKHTEDTAPTAERNVGPNSPIYQITPEIESQLVEMEKSMLTMLANLDGFANPDQTETNISELLDLCQRKRTEPLTPDETQRARTLSTLIKEDLHLPRHSVEPDNCAEVEYKHAQRFAPAVNANVEPEKPIYPVQRVGGLDYAIRSVKVYTADMGPIKLPEPQDVMIAGHLCRGVTYLHPDNIDLFPPIPQR